MAQPFLRLGKADAPGHTTEHLDCFLPGKTPSKQIHEAMVYMDKILQPEGIGVCEAVQRGLRSDCYNQDRFMADALKADLT